VGHAANGTNADVLVDKVLSSEIVEDLSIFDAFIIFALSASLNNFFEFLINNGLHCAEHFDKIFGLVLEDGVVGQKAEFLINALGPG